jgi:ADP-heptose:LPS heptosyltransferase
LPGVELISVQKSTGNNASRCQELAAPIIDFGPALDEQRGAFMDTAAIMKNVDLVITSDTSIAHLAGALAVPVWVALPHVADWRWFFNRSDSPWYPTMRLFRQKSSRDWSGVFADIRAALINRIQ